MQPGGGTHFRVWAPDHACVGLEWMGEEGWELRSMEAEPGGYFGLSVEEVGAGTLYRYRLESGVYPDPVSRYQPEGVHGPSQVVDPGAYQWRDAGWRGVCARGQVLYEMHVGTFTPEGTLASAARRIGHLRELGVTVVELMPLAEFAGRFGWGYDGVALYAPTRLYGDPEEVRAFVDCAHAEGIGVLLDVVYNHLGPSGNYLRQFAGGYFSRTHSSEWGDSLNLDGEGCGPVREWVVQNARYWIEEYHFDGLRLDATQQVFDDSAEHVLKVVVREARRAACGRTVWMVAENEPNAAELLRPQEEGGMGLDALWNDDFHHSAMVTLSGHHEAYYHDYRGTAQELLSALKHGFLFQGQRFLWQDKARGSSTRGLEPWRFVNFLQNHDQVANSLRGLRMDRSAAPGALRAMTALLLLGPGTPLLFQGQEFGASSPFVYFADHERGLAEAVARGRLEFLSQFASVGGRGGGVEGTHVLGVPDPGSEEMYRACQLDWGEVDGHGEVFALHQDLLRLRREDPVFGDPRCGGIDGAVLREDCMAVRFLGPPERLLLFNFGADLLLAPMAEPLLAPGEAGAWVVRWSSEELRYGGGGCPWVLGSRGWEMPGRAAVVLVPEGEVL